MSGSDTTGYIFDCMLLCSFLMSKSYESKKHNHISTQSNTDIIIFY